MLISFADGRSAVNEVTVSQRQGPADTWAQPKQNVLNPLRSSVFFRFTTSPSAPCLPSSFSTITTLRRIIYGNFFQFGAKDVWLQLFGVHHVASGAMGSVRSDCSSPGALSPPLFIFNVHSIRHHHFLSSPFHLAPSASADIKIPSREHRAHACHRERSQQGNMKECQRIRRRQKLLTRLPESLFIFNSPIGGLADKVLCYIIKSWQSLSSG